MRLTNLSSISNGVWQKMNNVSDAPSVFDFLRNQIHSLDVVRAPAIAP